MASVEEIKEIRLQKLNKIKEAGIDPYPSVVNKTHSVQDVLSDFDNLAESETEIILTGRIMSLRGQGAISFIDLFDGTSKIQILFKKDESPKYINHEMSDSFDFFQEVIDISDFAEFKGVLMTSKRGEKSLLAKEWMIVTKSLRQVPDSFYGIKDEDDRYRQRYLDILLNQEVKNRIIQKSVFWNTIRKFLLDKNYTEVQTPVLETTPGGAEAKPFVTKHNALDLDVFLRISAGELWQKKLMIAGLPKTFEIGRIFRNEGMSNEHLQDYTQVEFYEAYSDYEKGMKMVRDLYIQIAQNTFGRTNFEINGHNVELNSDWQKIDYVEIIKERTGLNVLEASLEELVEKLKGLNIKFNPNEINRERATDLIWKSFRKEITGPAFLINVPVFLEPLAKKNKTNNNVVDRFQIIFAGSELGKGFSELNDPIDQESRFNHQESLREGGDDEAQMKDQTYVEAMEYGMPPAFGFGISERLFSVLAGVSVREASIFPLMRPRD